MKLSFYQIGSIAHFTDLVQLVVLYSSNEHLFGLKSGLEWLAFYYDFLKFLCPAVSSLHVCLFSANGCHLCYNSERALVYVIIFIMIIIIFLLFPGFT